MELEAPTKPLPLTPAGWNSRKRRQARAMRSFLLALNSGDLGACAAFIEDKDANLSFGWRDYERLPFQHNGGLKVQRITASSNYQIEVLAQFEMGNAWIKLSFEVEENAPHCVKRIGNRQC